MRMCHRCDGTGYLIQYRKGWGFVQTVRSGCPECQGEGKVVDERFRCTRCRGRKVVSEKKILEVHIEQGMWHGQRIVFDGEADEYVRNVFPLLVNKL